MGGLWEPHAIPTPNLLAMDRTPQIPLHYTVAQAQHSTASPWHMAKGATAMVCEPKGCGHSFGACEEDSSPPIAQALLY